MTNSIPENKKLTFPQVRNIIHKYHELHNIHYTSDRKMPVLRFRIVFDPFASNWRKFHTKLDAQGNIIPDETKPITYSLESCTYEITDTDKYWFGECCGNSLFARCLDKNEPDYNGIRLDYYLSDWKILYCYEVGNEEEN